MGVLNKYEDIMVSELLVDSENPRMMEELSNESDAINFLIEDIPQRMRSLAQDIAHKGYVYDPPLVRKEGKFWKVYDGNRRVSCVKLLLDPSILSDQNHVDYFEKLAKSNAGKIPTHINCRIEEDVGIINDILERRHAGGDTGIGQMPWKADEKDNFFVRTGKSYSPRFGTELSKLLREKGVISKSGRIKVSIFDRLMSSELYRNKVGITFKGKKIAFIQDEAHVLEILRHIIQDASSGVINLNKTWSKQEKNDYFQKLSDIGLLQSNAMQEAVLSNETPVLDDGLSDPVSSKNIKKKNAHLRASLIPLDFQLDFDPAENTLRIKNIFTELRDTLVFNRHLNAIAVMFRVLVEMCVDHYIETQKVHLIVHKKDQEDKSLMGKYKACLLDMEASGFITANEKNILVRYTYKGEFLSIDTFHSYVHHKLAHPIQSDLISMWNQMQLFIQQALRIRNKADLA